jgi:RNA exonuclease 4
MQDGRPSRSTRKSYLGYAHIYSVEIGRYVAMDCEMVGVGPAPNRESALARVSIVNFDGDQIYDSYVKPLEPVTDWRTHVSGILPKHMLEARSLTEVQDDVCKILQDRVLVGHALSHDLDVLFLSHPRRDIRDTARHPAYRKLAGGSSPRLKILASELLGLDIQVGEHSSVEDARACMLLFRRDKDAFEREHAKRFPAPRPPPVANHEASNGTDAPHKKSNKKKKKKKKK